MGKDFMIDCVGDGVQLFVATELGMFEELPGLDYV